MHHRQWILAGALLTALVATCFAQHRRKPAPAPTPSPPPTAAAKLIFSQEFDSSAALATDSNIKTSWPLGQGANSAATEGEMEIYVDTQSGDTWGPNPFAIANSMLTVTATPTKGLPAPYTYTSGVFSTAGTFKFQTGYVECKMKMCGGSGFWPTLWMMADPSATGGDLTWPPEIDIAQFSSRLPLEHYPAVLSGTSSSVKETGAFVPSTTSLASGFHIYGFEWTTTKLTWYLDGKPNLTCATPSGLSKPMFLMFSLAVGDNGDWIGKPDGSTQSVVIDYLRVWDHKP